jgi:hypothetical protein
MKIGLLIIGIVFALMGLVWIGQGTGYFPYPQGSFMVRQPQWAVYGAGLLILGLATVWLSRRR